MKRFLAAMTVGMTLAMGAVSVQAADLSVTLNGTAITFDAQPFIEEGITLVPVRAIMDSLDADVAWDAATKTVTVTKEDKTIILTIGSKQATVNGQAVELEAAAKIAGNRTFVPVKFIAEQIGLNVEWDAENQVVSLSEVVADVEVTPTEGEAQTSAEGEAPADVEVTPTEGEEAPTQGEETPAEGEQAPTEGEQTPAEGETAPTEGEQASAEGETAPTEGEQAPAEGEELVDGMRPEFKAEMDSFEAFYNEFCEFLENYDENTSTEELTAQYTELMEKATEIDEKFNAWINDGEMNEAEMKYYLDLQKRILQKVSDFIEEE